MTERKRVHEWQCGRMFLGNMGNTEDCHSPGVVNGKPGCWTGVRAHWRTESSLPMCLRLRFFKHEHRALASPMTPEGN